jgi:hypothetical protein
MSYVVKPISAGSAAALRADVASGRLAARRVLVDGPGAPCRSCLREADPGETVLLFTYQPFRGESPYAVPSPVFLHEQSCTAFDPAAGVPPLLRAGQRAVRSYDAEHNLLEGEVAQGVDVDALIEQLLGDRRAAYLHVYSATAGCFTCRVDRP